MPVTSQESHRNFKRMRGSSASARIDPCREWAKDKKPSLRLAGQDFGFRV